MSFASSSRDAPLSSENAVFFNLKDKLVAGKIIRVILYTQILHKRGFLVNNIAQKISTQGQELRLPKSN